MAFSILDFVRTGGGGDQILERPELAVSSGAAARTAAPGDVGLLRSGGPQVGGDFQAEKMGLLERLRQPDEQGLTLYDKLSAANSIWNDDSEGAGRYLQGRRAEVLNKSQRDEAKAALDQNRRAFIGAFGPDGKWSARQWAEQAGAAFDPNTAASLMGQFGPKQGSFQNAAGGLFYTHPDTGTVEQVVAPPAGGKLPWDWTIDPETQQAVPIKGGPSDPFYRGQRTAAEAGARARFRAPPRGRAPTSYAVGDVKVGP